MRLDGWEESDSAGRRDRVHTGPQWDIGPASCWASGSPDWQSGPTGWGPDTPGRLSHQFSWWRDAPSYAAPHIPPPPGTQCHRALTWHTQVPFPSMPSRQVPCRCMGSQHRRGTLQTHTHT